MSMDRLIEYAAWMLPGLPLFCVGIGLMLVLAGDQLPRLGLVLRMSLLGWTLASLGLSTIFVWHIKSLSFPLTWAHGFGISNEAVAPLQLSLDRERAWIPILCCGMLLLSVSSGFKDGVSDSYVLAGMFLFSFLIPRGHLWAFVPLTFSAMVMLTQELHRIASGLIFFLLGLGGLFMLHHGSSDLPIQVQPFVSLLAWMACTGCPPFHGWVFSWVHEQRSPMVLFVPTIVWYHLGREFLEGQGGDFLGPLMAISCAWATWTAYGNLSPALRASRLTIASNSFASLLVMTRLITPDQAFFYLIATASASVAQAATNVRSTGAAVLSVLSIALPIIFVATSENLMDTHWLNFTMAVLLWVLQSLAWNNALMDQNSDEEPSYSLSLEWRIAVLAIGCIGLIYNRMIP